MTLKGGQSRGNSYGVVTVSKDVSDRIKISFHYEPQLVAKVKTIEGRKWHPDEKYWRFPDSDGVLEKILGVFKEEKIHIDHTLQLQRSRNVIAKPDLSGRSNLKTGAEQSPQSQKDYSSNPPIPPLANPSPQFPPLARGGEGGFNDIRRELIEGIYDSALRGTVPDLRTNLLLPSPSMGEGEGGGEEVRIGTVPEV